MSETTEMEPRETEDSQLMTIRISKELAAKIAESSTAIGLGKSAMLRLAIARGLDRLLEQLEVSAAEVDVKADE